MKKYKVSTQPLVGGGASKEYVIEAESEESAKEMALSRMIAEESDGALLESPGQIFVAEEVGYFYGHESQPRNVTDLIDNLEILISEMRKTEDAETIPKYLKQYAWEYFREVEIDKEALQRLAIFVADRTYRIISNLKVMDDYTRAYFATVFPFLWDTLQNRGVDTFYILDNELHDDRFRAVVDLFKLTGVAVVTPYGEAGNLECENVEVKIREYMTPVRNIMYIEKDASVNYLDSVLKIAKESSYLCIFRNKSPDDPNVEVFNMS